MRTRLRRIGSALLGLGVVVATGMIAVSSAVAAQPAQERLFDVSYREANRVTGGRAYDWTDTFYWGAVGLVLVGITAIMLAIWWRSYRHGARHGRGPALPTH